MRPRRPLFVTFLFFLRPYRRILQPRDYRPPSRLPDAGSLAWLPVTHAPIHPGCVCPPYSVRAGHVMGLAEQCGYARKTAGYVMLAEFTGLRGASVHVSGGVQISHGTNTRGLYLKSLVRAFLARLRHGHTAQAVLPLPSARAPPSGVWGRQSSSAAGAAFPHGMTQNGADGGHPRAGLGAAEQPGAHQVRHALRAHRGGWARRLAPQAGPSQSRKGTGRICRGTRPACSDGSACSGTPACAGRPDSGRISPRIRRAARTRTATAASGLHTGRGNSRRPTLPYIYIRMFIPPWLRPIRM